MVAAEVALDAKHTATTTSGAASNSDLDRLRGATLARRLTNPFLQFIAEPMARQHPTAEAHNTWRFHFALCYPEGNVAISNGAALTRVFWLTSSRILFWSG